MALRVIAGEAGGRRLVAPKGDVRPTADRVKESLFAALGADRLEGAVVLDLYAGSGALGIEALSRGAATAVFVDKDHRAHEAIRTNLATTGFAERAHVSQAAVDSFLGRPRGRTGRRRERRSIWCSSTRPTTSPPPRSRGCWRRWPGRECSPRPRPW